MEFNAKNSKDDIRKRQPEEIDRETAKDLPVIGKVGLVAEFDIFVLFCAK